MPGKALGLKEMKLSGGIEKKSEQEVIMRQFSRNDWDI
jgi:hypothetical protein